MFAANAHFHVLAGRPATFYRGFDQFTDAGCVNRHKRIHLDDALFEIFTQETGRIIAADAEGGLCQVIGAKREELRGFGDFPGRQAGARQLDHGANHKIDIHAGFILNLLANRLNARGNHFQFLWQGNKRHHDFRKWRLSGAPRYLCGSFKDCPGLHLGDFRIGNGKAHTAMAKHRVEFVQLVHPHAQRFHIGIDDCGDLGDFVIGMRQEFMQGRIKQADGHRQPGHDLENGDKVIALHGQNLVQRLAPVFFALGQNHLTHSNNAVSFKEHVLGAAKTNAFSAKITRRPGIGGRIGIGAHAQPAQLVGPAHQRGEIIRQFRLYGGHLAVHDLPGGPVNGDDIALVKGNTGNTHGLRLIVNPDGSGP